MFTPNEGKADRAVRGIAGAALIVAAPFIGGALAIALAVVGAVLIITGATGFCALYALLGIDTRRGRPHRQHPARR